MLAIDIGNTQTRFCRFAPDGSVLWRESHPTPEINFTFVRSFFKSSGARHVVYSSVVRPCNVFIEKGMKEAGAQEVFCVTPARHRILPHHLATPETTGSDRLLSALAASSLYSGEAVIVLQAGTALTVDSVGGDGVFRGGFILPGPQMWLDSLSSAAQLPYFPPEEIDWNALEPGDSTRTAILHGAVHGLCGAAAGAVAAHRQALGGEGAGAKLVVTGGWGRRLAEHLPAVYEEELVLRGLFRFAQKNNIFGENNA